MMADTPRRSRSYVLASLRTLHPDLRLAARNTSASRGSPGFATAHLAIAGWGQIKPTSRVSVSGWGRFEPTWWVQLEAS
jgi:hypothetical protein